jgi:hypothetical protein
MIARIAPFPLTAAGPRRHLTGFPMTGTNKNKRKTTFPQGLLARRETRVIMGRRSFQVNNDPQSDRGAQQGLHGKVGSITFSLWTSKTVASQLGQGVKDGSPTRAGDRQGGIATTPARRRNTFP